MTFNKNVLKSGNHLKKKSRTSTVISSMKFGQSIHEDNAIKDKNIKKSAHNQPVIDDRYDNSIFTYKIFLFSLIGITKCK